MNFDDALKSTAKRPGNACAFAKQISSLSKVSQEQLQTAMADATLTHSHIARAIGVLTESKVDPDTVGRHRRGDCRQCAA